MMQFCLRFRSPLGMQLGSIWEAGGWKLCVKFAARVTNAGFLAIVTFLMRNADCRRVGQLDTSFFAPPGEEHRWHVPASLLS